MATRKPAAKAEDKTEDNTEAAAPSGQGRAVILPSGERRIDFIKRRYYEENATRSEIAKELTELQGKTVPYQIVFAATKAKRDGEDGGDE